MEKIYNENALTTLKKLKNESVDLIVTSPPYDLLRQYKTKNKKEFEKIWNFDIFKKIANELTRVLKQGGVIAWIVGDGTIKGSETGTSFKQALYFKEECGLNIDDTMIYQKNGFSYPSITRYHQVFEYIFIFSKGKPKTFNPIEDRINKYFNVKSWGKNSKRQKDELVIISKEKKVLSKKITGKRTNVWLVNTGYSLTTADKIAFQHPAIFPERLVADIIKSWSNPGDLVLDPFLGSGTTMKMTVLLNRHCIGIEINKDYIDIIKARVKKAYELKNSNKLPKWLNKNEYIIEEVIKIKEKELKELQNYINRLKKMV